VWVKFGSMYNVNLQGFAIQSELLDSSLVSRCGSSVADATFALEVFTNTPEDSDVPEADAQFGGTIGAYINIGFGVDTFGIQGSSKEGAQECRGVAESSTALV